MRNALPEPTVAISAVGAPGAATGIAGFDGAEGSEEPAPLIATTAKMYETPFVSPVIVQVSDPLLQVQLCPPGDAVAVYAVMVSPPLAAEALQVIVASPAAVETVTFDGALANARGLPVTAALTGEEPMAVSAIAVKV